MTCARSVPTVETFVGSYLAHVGRGIPWPVVIVDLTASSRLPRSYLALLDRLSPVAIYFHARCPGVSDYDSIQDAAFFALRCGSEEIVGHEYLLFLEDDIVFSSRFLPFLSKLVLEEDTGLYTFYLPGDGFGSAVIEPFRYYGTQCVCLPKDVLPLILDNRQEMERRFSPGYDQRWANFLGARGFKLYASPQSYVQHIGVTSRIGSGYHWSRCYVA
jgi:hypothetical protein